MPMLTTTAEEIDRIVACGRARPSREVTDGRMTRWSANRRVAERAATAASERALGPVAVESGTLDGRGPASTLDGRAGRLVRLERLPRASRQHPAVVAAAHEAHRSQWGTGSGASRLDRRWPAGPRTTWRPSWPTGRRQDAAVLLPDRASPPTSASSSRSLGGPEVTRAVRRAEPRVDHRRLPPQPGPRWRSTATATSTTSTRSCWPSAGRSARRHRHRVLHGRRRAPTSTRSPTLCAAPRRAARARRGPRRARARPARRPRRRRRAGGHPVEDPRLARRLRRRPRAPHRPAGEPGPRRTSSPRPPPPPTPRRRWPRCGSCARPRARRSSRACAATWTGSDPATPRRSSRSCWATRTGAWPRRPRLLDAGPARARHPPADGRPRHSSPVRVTLSAAHTDEDVDQLLVALDELDVRAA